MYRACEATRFCGQMPFSLQDVNRGVATPHHALAERGEGFFNKDGARVVPAARTGKVSARKRRDSEPVGSAERIGRGGQPSWLSLRVSADGTQSVQAACTGTKSLQCAPAGGADSGLEDATGVPSRARLLCSVAGSCPAQCVSGEGGDDSIFCGTVALREPVQHTMTS